MSRIHKVEPLVLRAFLTNPQTRRDDFVLIENVLATFVSTEATLSYVMLNHKKFGIPSLETITRCRRKLQERDPSLKEIDVAMKREGEESNFVDYALQDKQWY